MPRLFDEEEDVDSDVEIKTDNDYATQYNLWRQKEELNKLKTKYGDPSLTNDDLLASDSSSSDDEDEDGRELTAEFEKDFFKTLSCLKDKDPKIYDDTTVFFKENPDETTGEEREKKSKKKGPLYMKDYERKMILEKGAVFEESDEEQGEDARARSPTYVEEQRRLKESLKQALDEDDNEEDNWGGLFKKRQKTQEEAALEEEDYKKWLKGHKEQLDNKEEESALRPLKDYWDNPALDNTESFLRDYLLNKRYLEKEDSNHVPTYEEIIHDSDDGFSEDEKNLDTQEEFEQKYNFRYEEPDQDFIKRYPRTMEHSVRKTDDRRKVKRQEVRERKVEEKKQKQEDLKTLKVLKRREIGEKIKKLKEITGNDDLAFQDADLDGDFDPEAHDRRMQELFNDGYYGGEEGDLKPEFSDLDEELGPWKDNNEMHCEDDNFVMDCDYDPAAAPKEKGKKKRNRPGKKQRSGEDEIAVDENDEQYEEYMDELYKLDYEDMIGDIPCRFKYRDVVPNDFGLTVEEILLAKDRELNRWCSLKKATQYRADHMEKYDVIAYQRKAANEDLKKKLLPSLYSEDLEENLKDLGRKQQMNNDENEEYTGNDENEEYTGNEENNEDAESNEIEEKSHDTRASRRDESLKESKAKKKSKKNAVKMTENGDETLNSTVGIANVDSSGNNVKKNKKKLNKSVNGTEKADVLSNSNENAQNADSPKKRRKRKQTPNDSATHETENTNAEAQNRTSNKLTRRQRKNKKIKLIPKEPKTPAEQKTEPKEGKKSRKRKQSERGTADSEITVPKKKQKLKKTSKVNKKAGGAKAKVAISDSRLEAYGLNPKKFKNKLKYKNTSSGRKSV